MAKKQAKVDDIANWEDIAEECPEFKELAEEYADNRETIKLLEARNKDELAPQLEAAVIIGGKKSIAGGNWKVTQGRGKSADRVLPERVVEKLASLGADAEQILEIMKYCTEPGKPYTYPVVTKVEVEVTDE